ncbi:putative ribonuclease H-like domain-containing protein [Tanacetum coccineum]
MCDKKNKVLFTDSECLVMSPDFKLPDENQVLLRIPRQNNMYSFNIENIVPSGGLACLIKKAIIDGSNKWHRRTLIEAARTMLADSFLPNTFWAEAVSTACYVLNRVLVTKPQNKTPYELITGKSDEGFLVGYSLNSKAFRPMRLENQANKTAGPTEANHSAGTQDNIDPTQDYFVLQIYSSYTSTVKNLEANDEGEKSNKDTGLKTNEEPVDQEDQEFLEELERLKRQENEANDAVEALRKEFAQEAKDLLI